MLLYYLLYLLFYTKDALFCYSIDFHQKNITVFYLYLNLILINQLTYIYYASHLRRYTPV